MKSKIFFIPLFLFFLSFNLFAQEPENGSFEDISCKMSDDCDIFYFFDGCMGPRWHNANRQPRVLENECVFNAFETPFGDKVLQVAGSSFGGDDLPVRYGDAFFYDMEMMNSQSFDISFWGKTHYWDAWVTLEFYAVKEMEESTELILSLWPLEFIDLTGGYDIHVAAQEWQKYTIPLSLDNIHHPIGGSPAAQYNHLLIVARHHGWGQVPAVAYLDNFSITPCTYDSEATIFHHIDQEDCGNIEFVLDCDLSNVKKFIWDFGDGSDLLQTESAEINHLFQNAGEYTVKLTIINEDGCIDKLTAHIKVSCDRCPGMEANFEHELESQTENYTYDPETGEWIVDSYNCNYQFTDLSVVSPGHNIVSWQWDFGNGTTSTEQNPAKTLLSGGLYTICLTVEDNRQCTDTFCEELQSCTGKVSIPGGEGNGRSTAIDNDLMNWQVYPNPFQESLEVTYPISTELERAQIKLFNIKGEEVFQKRANTSGRDFLDLQGLTSGIYFLVTINAKGEVLYQQQVIKK